MAENRYVGEYPVIGIRPTIDGRRGYLKVRESLEEQTMNMAKSAAKLFTENLRYSNGEPVKVIIADTTIGRVGEAAACADKFRKAGVDITLTVTPCWCYGAETMDMDPRTIKGVWGFNGTERPGFVSDGRLLRLPPCGENPTCRSVPFVWESAAPSLTRRLLKNIWACAWSPWTRWKSSAA